MARKPFTPQVPTQFKHLRFLDTDTNTILNNGGYTLAYRCFHIPAQGDAPASLLVRYAYSECNLADNFNKAAGRSRAYNRLNHGAAEYSTEFSITGDIANDQTKLISLGQDIVDVKGHEFDLAEAVIREFLREWGSVLYLGEDETQFLNNLVEYRNGLAIDAEVLSYIHADDLDSEALLDDMVEVLEVADAALAKLNKPLDFTNSAAVTALLDEVRKDLTTIREVLLENGVSNEVGEDSADEEDDAEPSDDDSHDEVAEKPEAN